MTLPRVVLELPDEDAKRVLAFLERRSTGQIVLHVHRGAIGQTDLLDLGARKPLDKTTTLTHHPR